MDYPADVLFGFDREDLYILLEGMRKHNSQWRRTDYMTAIKYLTAHAGQRGRLLGQEEEFANPFSVRRRIHNGKITNVIEKAKMILSRLVPLSIVSPHPDDKVIAAGGPTLQALRLLSL